MAIRNCFILIGLLFLVESNCQLLDDNIFKNLVISNFNEPEKSGYFLRLVETLMSYYYPMVPAKRIRRQSLLPFLTQHQVDPEVDMDTEQLITTHGYSFEEHHVTTEDGYILTLHRIPAARPLIDNGRRPPAVLIQHGLLCDSSFWLLNLPHQNLPLLLAESGIDVWLGNNRGNRYSKQHQRLSPDSEEFWDFSWDEMAAYDLPAMIEYIRNATSNEKIFYVGHSEGNLIGFAGFSKMSEAWTKVHRFYALAPVATVGYIDSPIRQLPKHMDELANFFGKKDFLGNPFFFSLVAKSVCAAPEMRPMCAGGMLAMFGMDNLKNFNMTRVPVYISHSPSSTSVKNLRHFAQMVLSKKFQAFDYGSSEANLQRYNQATAPLYNASNVLVPTVAFTGGADTLADPRDVLNLLGQLPVLVDIVSLDDYNHIDFVWGLDANRKIFDYIVSDILTNRSQKW